MLWIMCIIWIVVYLAGLTAKVVALDNELKKFRLEVATKLSVIVDQLVKDQTTRLEISAWFEKELERFKKG